MTAALNELLLISITIPPRDVERLLEALAELPYPINPDLKYEEWQTTVAFPAYISWLPELRTMLTRPEWRDARLEYACAVKT
jgi:hypothetical protein